MQNTSARPLTDFLVFYQMPDLPDVDPPLAMRFQAENEAHAQEQLLNAEPDAVNPFVFRGTSLADGLAAWRDSGRLKIEATMEIPAWVAEDYGEEAAQKLALAVVLAEATPTTRGSIGAAWSLSRRETPCFVGRPGRLDYYSVPLLGIVNGPPGSGVRVSVEMPDDVLLDTIDGLDEVTDFIIEHAVAQIRISNVLTTIRRT